MFRAPEKGESACAYFLAKFAPKATEGVFRMVAAAYLHQNGYPDVDLDHLSGEQEVLLLRVFEKLSPQDVEEWVVGLAMAEYWEQDTARLRREVDEFHRRNQKNAAVDVDKKEEA